MQGRLNFLAAALVLGLLAACAPSPEREREAITRELLAHPDSRESWEVIKRHYPAEFADLVERIRALEPGQRNGSPAMRKVIDQWLPAYLRSIAPDIAHASPRTLRDIARADLRLSEHLAQKDVDACANFTIGGGISFAPGTEMDEFGADLAGLNTANVIAAAEGRDRPVDHAEPRQAEIDKVVAGLADSGVDPIAARAIGNPAALRSMTSAENCALGVGFKRSVLRLPDDALARVVTAQIKRVHPQPQRRSGNTRR